MAKEHDIEVEWKAFELRPEGEDTPDYSPEYYEQAKSNVEQMSRHYGVEMRWNNKSKHSRHALEGAKFARLHGKENDYHDAVFRAHFQQDKTINDIDTLVEIGEDIGLDGEALREALLSRRYEKQVLADIQLAREIGVTAVPCYIAGTNGVMGAQSYDSLLQLLNK